MLLKTTSVLDATKASRRRLFSENILISSLVPPPSCARPPARFITKSFLYRVTPTMGGITYFGMVGFLHLRYLLGEKI
jgi:hypothetical protein